MWAARTSPPSRPTAVITATSPTRRRSWTSARWTVRRCPSCASTATSARPWPPPGAFPPTRPAFGAVDRYGAPRPYGGGQVGFDVAGPAVLIGDNPFDFAAAGGAGAVWIRSRPGAAGPVTVTAGHPGLGSAAARVRVRGTA